MLRTKQSINNMMGVIDYQSVVPSENSSKLELFVSCRNLYDLEVFSKSDPYVKVFIKNKKNSPYIRIGRTETASNNLNPNFRKSFLLQYIFEATQMIKFEVCDEDDVKNEQNDKYMGEVETTIGALAGAKLQTSILPLRNSKMQGKSMGSIVMRLEPASQSSQVVAMKWYGRKLMNTDSWFDWWDKSDPYLKFLKIRNDKSLVEVFRTEVIDNDLNPNWLPFEIPLNRLISDQNTDQLFKIECWDFEDGGDLKHQFIGELFLKIGDLQKPTQAPKQYRMKNLKEKNPGTLFLERFSIVYRPCFVDFLKGGLELNLSVAIDFTGSNGIPTSPTSLHYRGKIGGNNYQTAINAVGNILLNYDSDKRIPAFGFGAKTRFNGMVSPCVSHCFPLSGNSNKVEAEGLSQLMQMYSYALSQIQLSGPTLFQPLLREFVSYADKNEHVYQILLILTDGEIHDMDKTVELLVSCCKMSISIIIVGIGNADFTKMKVLDGDDGLYNSKGIKAPRDMVQFVSFNQTQNDPDLLAKQLLAELPTQVEQYMHMIGRLPEQQKVVDMNTIFMPENPQGIEYALKNNLAQKLIGLVTQQKVNPYGME